VSTVDNLLSIEDGGKVLYMPRGHFYSAVDQTAAVANTGYPVSFEVTSVGDGVSINGGSNTQITVSADGVYALDINLQFEHNNASEVTVWTWISRNGVAMAYTGRTEVVGGNAYNGVHKSFILDLSVGDYIEVYWATSDTQLNLHSEAATALHPGISSAKVSVSFVSNN
jgi:hypothetical protein